MLLSASPVVEDVKFCEMGVPQGASKCALEMCGAGPASTWSKIIFEIIWEMWGSSAPAVYSYHSTVAPSELLNTAYAVLFTAHGKNKNYNSLQCSVIFQEIYSTSL